ncbi:MAG TPA: tetratricopeptide repeat protein [Syntrophorhabdaceae bacterium]|nr:tetratricopeptide repeat protein [Syntrophorhabdaceae bacterium]
MGFFRNLFSLGKNKTYMEAMQLFNAHDYRGAIKKFEEILKDKTSATSIHHNLSRVYISQSHRNLGIILFALGKYAEALNEFNMAIHYNQQFNELYYFIGVCQNNLGDFKSAIDSFKTVIEVDPSNLPARMKLGVALHNYGMWDTAESVYKSILKTHPNYADIHYNLGLSYLGRGKIDEAVESFKNAININPNYLQPRIKLIVVQIYKGELEKAITELTNLSEKYTNFADIFYYLGIAYASSNQFDKALENFTRAVEINPSYKDARIKLGTLYCYTGKYEEGIKEFEEACKIDPLDEDLTMIMNAIKNAVSTYDKTSINFSEIISGLFHKGIPDLIPEFNRGVQIIPDVSEMISIIMSIAEEDRTLCEMLIPFVKEHILENRDYPDLHNSLGALYLKLNKYEEAEGCFRRAVEINPKYMKAHFNLFYTLKMLRKFEDALKEGEYIIENGMRYPDVYSYFAEVCLMLSLYEKAIESIKKALEINSKYSLAHFIAAQIYEKLGDKTHALYHINECINSNPSGFLNAMAKEMLERLEKE